MNNDTFIASAAWAFEKFAELHEEGLLSFMVGLNSGVHLSRPKFAELSEEFTPEVTRTSRAGDAVYPYEYSFELLGVRFYCITHDGKMKADKEGEK